jgi:hypothetical protein
VKSENHGTHGIHGKKEEEDNRVAAGAYRSTLWVPSLPIDPSTLESCFCVFCVFRGFQAHAESNQDGQAADFQFNCVNFSADTSDVSFVFH